MRTDSGAEDVELSLRGKDNSTRPRPAGFAGRTRRQDSQAIFKLCLNGVVKEWLVS